MSERKVLNKYYPPTFDPSKIPKVKGPKNRTFSIRVMAPFNMRCNTCGVYIYKGKKFNSRKENVDDEFYFGLRIFRFYIKCPCCVAEIAFKTNLKDTDYTLEAGATRLFEAEKLAKKMAEEEQKAKDEEDLNPMKVLENRTKASRNEIEQLDTLEELRELNTRNAAVDHQHMIQLHSAYEENLKRLQDEEDENMIQSLFGTKDGMSVKRLVESDSDGETEKETEQIKRLKTEKPADILSEKQTEKEPKKLESWQKSVGTFSGVGKSKKSLAGLIVKKKPKVETASSNSVINSNSDNQSDSKSLNTSQSETVKQASQSETVKQASQSETVKQASQSQTAKQNSQSQTQINSITSQSKSGINALGMLGGYSDSESGSE